ncbi:ABC transporter permease [Protaetiibacter intestinalis]|uniref:Transport permease protein n=1 Tax=Protaetiibacter intestinalis TaxID=2419774 RepID=A0A387B7L0_9MICO|nr:ABC transporter permease [Protaetiibacter intestinalis]AYF98333.1 ABC transporter permease [Protaetiibacter intestinalis]
MPLSEFNRSRELFVNLTQRELKGKYKRTILGQLWSLANPLALMVVYSFVFAFIIRATPEPGDPSGLDIFPLWLLCGLLPWIFFSNVVNQGMGALIANESLIKKVYFPRHLLVLSVAAGITVTWATEMGVLLVAIMIAGAWQAILWSPLVLVTMAFLAVFSVGIALMLSIANVYFRDTQYLVTIVLQLGLYLAPIVYPISFVETQSNALGPLFWNVTLLDIYSLNPFVRFTAVFRSLLYDNTWPEVGDILYVVVISALSVVIGWWVFSRHEKRLAELL